MFLLLKLKAEAAKSLNERSITDVISVSWLLSPKTFISSSGKGGSCREAELSEKSIM